MVSASSAVPLSPDLNLTPVAAFFTFFAERKNALGKNVKKQQEVSDLNQDYVPLSLDKSYNWPLLNRLILRFWPLGLRHGSDWLVSLLWHQYILITFVDTLTNSLHGTRPTELAVLSPFKSDRSHFFPHIRNLIQNGKVHLFGDQYFSITLGDSH